MSNLLDNRYRVGPIIGLGGFGVVHRGERELPDGRSLPVAIKFLRPELIDDEYARTLFVQEARIGLEVGPRHPALTAVYDMASIDGMGMYAVSELVDGITLRSLVRYYRDRDPSVPIVPYRITRRILRTCLEALAMLHASGIAHRDITSNNVMLARAGQVYLIDFGMALTQSDPDAQAAQYGDDVISDVAALVTLILGATFGGRKSRAQKSPSDSSSSLVDTLPDDVPSDLRHALMRLHAPCVEISTRRMAAKVAAGEAVAEALAILCAHVAEPDEVAAFVAPAVMYHENHAMNASSSDEKTAEIVAQQDAPDPHRALTQYAAHRLRQKIRRGFGSCALLFAIVAGGQYLLPSMGAALIDAIPFDPNTQHVVPRVMFAHPVRSTGPRALTPPLANTEPAAPAEDSRSINTLATKIRTLGRVAPGKLAPARAERARQTKSVTPSGLSFWNHKSPKSD